MARLDTRVLKEKPGVSLPWKVIFLLLGIGAIWAYIGYKYVQYRVPSRTLQVAESETKAPKPLTKARPPRSAPQRPPTFLQMVNELDLTSDQRKQIEQIAKETTIPRVLRGRINRVLTVQQREQLTSKTKELAAKRAQEQKARLEKQKENAAKLKKYYGNEAEYAAQASRAIRQQAQMRRQPVATPTPPGTQP